MVDDILEKRFEAFLAALRTHFEACLEYQDMEDENVLEASEQLEDAFLDYDEALYDELDIEMPLMTFDLDEYDLQDIQEDMEQFVRDYRQAAESDTLSTFLNGEDGVIDFDEDDEDEEFFDDPDLEITDSAAKQYDYEYSAPELFKDEGAVVEKVEKPQA